MEMISLLTHRLAAPVLLVALIASLATAGLQTLSLREARRSLDASIAAHQRTTELYLTCQNRVKAQDDAIASQNARVRAAEAEAAQMQERAVRAASDALRAKQRADKRIADIMAAQSGSNTCQSADDLILGVTR
ncbi:hypothetical protein D3C72_481000 [compost metagenome]